MQFAVAALALAATVSATYGNGTNVYTTEVHTALTTVCPSSTELTFNGVTYTAHEATTLVITDCPCTVVKPVPTTYPAGVPITYPAAPAPSAVYPTYNGTAPTAPAPTKSAVGTTSAPTATPTAPLIANGAEKVAMSGASLAGLLGLAAYLL